MTPIERRFVRIYEIGCIACYRRGWFNECQVHHQNLDEHAGQQRLGDEFTIGLCPWHHVGEPIGGLTAFECGRLLGPSMKHQPLKFRETFGSDQDLLRLQNERIEEAESAVVGRRIA